MPLFMTNFSVFGYSSLSAYSFCGLYERGDHMLNVQALNKHYGQNQVLNQVSFSAKKGDIIGLVGENGAGKSTLLHILATLEVPTNGQITLDKQSFKQHHKQIRPNIGFVPQDIALWDEFTVEENMVFFEKLSCKKRKDRKSVV